MNSTMQFHDNFWTSNCKSSPWWYLHHSLFIFTATSPLTSSSLIFTIRRSWRFSSKVFNKTTLQFLRLYMFDVPIVSLCISLPLSLSLSLSLSHYLFLIHLRWYIFFLSLISIFIIIIIIINSPSQFLSTSFYQF